MTIGTAIITDALKEIGVVSAVSPPAPESIEDGRKKLNSMLEMWLSRGIVLAFSPLDQVGDDLNEPADARNGIITNLALELAPLFNNGKQIVSPQLQSNAGRDFANIKSLYSTITIPRKVLSSTTPVGAGNSRGARHGRTFWRKGAGVTN